MITIAVVDVNVESVTNLVIQMLFGHFSDALVAGAQGSEVFGRFGTHIIVELEHNAPDW